MTSVPKPSMAGVKRRGYKRPAPMESLPTEDEEQRTVADWLDAHGVLWFHVPNGGFRHIATAMRLKKLGLKAGVPDIIIVDRPGMVENGKLYVGAAIEMKRRRGGMVSPEQNEWLLSLEQRGWKCKVAKGSDEAIKFLTECGYAERED